MLAAWVLYTRVFKRRATTRGKSVEWKTYNDDRYLFFFYNKPNVVLRFLNGISFPSHRKGRDDEFNEKMLLLGRSDQKDTRVKVFIGILLMHFMFP